MDRKRFDIVAKELARGTTRRHALRLAGGGLAGALLAAAGLGRRAGAQDAPCDELLARCFERGEATCGPKPVNSDGEVLPGDWLNCVFSEVPVCHSYAQVCDTACRHMGGCGQVGCPGDQVCVTAVNPGNQIVCRCIEP